MLIEATSQNSIGALRYAYKSSSRVACAWNAWPASCKIVSTSRCKPIAFMKMNGTRASERF